MSTWKFTLTRGRYMYPLVSVSKLGTKTCYGVQRQGYFEFHRIVVDRDSYQNRYKWSVAARNFASEVGETQINPVLVPFHLHLFM